MPTQNIKGIILDVDGVIIGDQIGVNSPDPHPDVIRKLKTLSQSGLKISLCSAKPHFSIDRIIRAAELNSLHITDGGAVVINPVDNKIVSKHIIDTKLVEQVLKKYLEHKIYTEYYTTDGYFVQKDFLSKITKGHTHVLSHDPIIVESLIESCSNHEITKIMPIARDLLDKQKLIKIFEEFKDQLTLSWGVHPVIEPLQFGIITSLNISKKQGAIDISNSTGILFDNLLAVGDSTSDWQFIELCKYGAAMGNASEELKRLVALKGEGCWCVGKSVNENGILGILEYFL